MERHQNGVRCKAAYLDSLLDALRQAGIDPFSLNSTRLPVVAPTLLHCPGTTYAWGLGSPHFTYPSALHDPTSTVKTGYRLISINPEDSTIKIRASLCSGISVDGTKPCSNCQQTRAFVDVIEERASRDPKHLDRKTLSYQQLYNLYLSIQSSAQSDRLKLLNATRALKRLHVRQNTWEKILGLVGSNDVPALHRIFRNAKNQNWSTKALLENLRLAVNGQYLAKNFSEFEYDLATVVYELGGGAALYALQKSPFALPSRNCVLARRQHFRLRISCGAPTMIEIMENIETTFEDPPPAGRRVGVALLMDEMAVDGRLVYLAKTDDLAGLCEHAKQLGSTKMGENTEVIRNIAIAVREGKIHVGDEIFVAAFARNDDSEYSARPVLLLPTCKQSDCHDQALIIEMLRQAWKISPYGESLHGPIWSIASDGDPKRRPALYLHCMVRQMQPSDALFSRLGHLPGLNLWTGSNGETQDLDYKHNFKRICKLLCTREGIAINDSIINKQILSTWLERLTDVDWSENPIFSLLNPGSAVHEKIQTLLSPKDAQDVPRAVKLLKLTSDLRKIDASDLNPSETSTHSALCLLGEMLDALIEPFTDPTCTLSQQIISLVKFAHIACALFMKHEGDFMPQHLYSDLQCMFRTAIFRVAHTQIFDPSLKVFLCLLGDDVLEVEFGRVRMINGHAPNGDVEVVAHNFGSSRRLNTIFQKYPHLERKPNRLKLQRTRDLDHLTPRNWTGDLRATSCNLAICWAKGVYQAESILSKHGYSICFAEHFRNWTTSRVDLLRPKGGKYPGVSAEIDRSLMDTSETASGNKEVDLNADYAFKRFDGLAVLAAERQAVAQAQPSSIMMELEGGFLAHKKSVARIFMDRAGDINFFKSPDRLLRVRCYSIGGDSWDRSKLHLYQSSTGEGIFKLGSLFLAPVCVGGTHVGFAILQCTNLKSASQCLDRAPASEISLPDSSYEVSGQILSLESTLFQDLQMKRLIWIWDSQYVALDGIKSRSKSTTVTRVRHLSITMSGSLILPLLLEELFTVETSALPLSPPRSEV
ncbi:hypothetical protein D9619_013711 [Psilocybe cf. subviscida]|uniref:Uncharacterized protein n=1 Tax=Psilocybe cf. subviscida TaxID=2480587 RepID=A0A8H5AZ53_9AGAR|nr:hypothetical protein D9619_013711 [Psilocybe cf. subviscida]